MTGDRAIRNDLDRGNTGQQQSPGKECSTDGAKLLCKYTYTLLTCTIIFGPCTGKMAHLDGDCARAQLIVQLRKDLYT